MDYKKVAESVKLCGSRHGIVQCKLGCIFFAGNDMNKCIPKMTENAATAITDLLARAEAAEAAQETLQRAMAEYKARAEKAERERDELFNLLDDTCKDVRERHVDDSVCGLCEYDGVHSSESGDCVNECPGFDIDDCFCMKKSIQEKYGQKGE